MSGGTMQPGIPDTAYLWVAGLTLLIGALMMCAGMAWPRLSAWRWYLRRRRPAPSPRRRQSPGQRVDAALRTPVIRPAAPGTALTPAQTAKFAAIVAANPDLAAIDAATVADMFLLPPEEGQQR